MGRLEGRVQDAAGASHERPSGRVLVPARGFAYEHDGRAYVTFTRHGVGPSGVEAATRARADGVGGLFQGPRPFSTGRGHEAGTGLPGFILSWRRGPSALPDES